MINVEMMNMLHNESRNLLVQAFEKNHNAKQTAEDFSVSLWTVYRLRQQMKQTGSVDLRVNQRGRKARECFKTIKVTKPKYRQVKQRHENRQPSFHTG